LTYTEKVNINLHF